MEPLFISVFPQEENLCPVKCLAEYEKRTQSWRSENSQLLLAIIAPHKPVTSSSIARWLKDILESSGVDISLFSAHSTRSASASAAALSGMTTMDIMRRAGWSQESTFCTFYYRLPDNERLATQFTETILKGKCMTTNNIGHVDRLESSVGV